MSLTTIDFLIVFFLSPLGISIVSCAIGYFVIQLFKIQVSQYFTSITCWLIGLVIINTFASIGITRGVTVQLCFIPILLFLLGLNHQTSDRTKFNFRAFGELLVPILLLNFIWSFFFFSFFYSFLTHSNTEQALYQDIYYYVRVSESLWSSGHENILNGLNFSSTFPGGTTPYHYFELYQNLILSKTFNVSSLWSFLVSVPIVYTSISSLLVISILRTASNSYTQYFLYGLGTLLLFASGLNIVPVSYVENGAYSQNMMNHVTPKYAGIFIILLLSSYFVYIKKYKHAAIILCSIQVLTFMMTPVVLWGTFIGSLVLRIFKKISTRDLFQIVSFALFTTLTIFAFYALTSIPTAYQGLAVNYGEVLNGLLNNFFSTIKKILGTHVYYLLDYLIFVVPILIIFYFNREKFKSLSDLLGPIIFIFILFEGGIISTWLLYDFHGEGWQPQYYALCVGSIVLIVWTYLTLRTINKNQSRFYLLITIIVCLINLGNTFTNHRITNDKRFAKYDVSKPFFDEAKLIFSNKGNVAVGFIETDPISPLVYPVGNILLHANSQINLECIDLSIINSDKDNYKNCSFREFVKKHGNEHDVEKMQLKFVKQNNIKYFIGYGVLDKESALYLNSEEILRDSLSSLFIRKIQPSKDEDQSKKSTSI